MSASLESVSVRFADRWALREVSASFEPGRVHAVIGGDGAGKSTLLRVLVGAVAPTEGRVERPERHRIGYAPASSGTYGDLTVTENLDFTATAYGMGRAAGRQRAADLLERTGLASVAGRRVEQLSGGMRQKLAVVRALLHEPELVVLDELTTGVDPVSRADLWWLVAQAAAEGSAVVLSTSYVSEAERAATALLLEAGELVAEGAPAALRAAVPGRVAHLTSLPEGADHARAWRRGRGWRLWEPDAPSLGSADLADAVVVAVLAREGRAG